MKKVLLLAVAGMFVLASCKKDYTCACTASIGEISSTSSVTLHAKKSDAKTACESQNSSTSGYYATTVKCEIK
jgi:hypothetical protein